MEGLSKASLRKYLHWLTSPKPTTQHQKQSGPVANLDENWMRDLHPSLGQQAQSTELGLSQTDIRWIAIILATAIASALVTGLLW